MIPTVLSNICRNSRSWLASNNAWIEFNIYEDNAQKLIRHYLLQYQCAQTICYKYNWPSRFIDAFSATDEVNEQVHKQIGKTFPCETRRRLAKVVMIGHYSCPRNLMAQYFSKPGAVIFELVLREQVRQTRDGYKAKGHNVSKSSSLYSLRPLLSNRLPYSIVDNGQRRHSENVDHSGIL